MRKSVVALFVVSLAGNAVFLALIIFAAVADRPKSFTFFPLDRGGAPGVTAACIVSLPPENADVAFGAAAISLRVGGACSLQYSLFRDGSQLNIAFDPLYDHDLVSVERSGIGITVRALAAGKCLLQSVTGEGITTIAVVTITDQ
jgi:hypothetical protein